MQGDPAPLCLHHSAGAPVDGAGLLLLRRLWDRFGIGRFREERTCGLAGVLRPSLLVETWIALLCYGGG